jgi:hypothetical protein
VTGAVVTGVVTGVAALLIVLHRGDGGEVTVASSHVTSLRAPAGPLHGLAPTSGCLVGLDDGKFVGVLEACGQVRRQIEEGGR